jgi:hypothetical protein
MLQNQVQCLSEMTCAPQQNQGNVKIKSRRDVFMAFVVEFWQMKED